MDPIHVENGPCLMKGDAEASMDNDFGDFDGVKLPDT